MNYVRHLWLKLKAVTLLLFTSEDFHSFSVSQSSGMETSMNNTNLWSTVRYNLLNGCAKLCSTSLYRCVHVRDVVSVLVNYANFIEDDQ